MRMVSLAREARSRGFYGPLAATLDAVHRTRDMTRRSPARNARLIYAGVALASGGIAFYVPLMLSKVGLAHSGAWAAGILFGTNLGRLLGSHVASRRGAVAQRRGVIVGNIVVEGVALFSMAFLDAPWMLVAVATVAGLGSGMSFPGMKTALLRLDGLDPSRAFAGLSMSLRLGMAGGYLAGALVGGDHLVAVFSVLLAMFVAYAGCMHVVLRDIEAAAFALASAASAALAAPAVSAVSAASAASAGQAAHASSPATAAVAPAGLAWLMAANVAFWFLAIQPTVTMSLYVPRYVPGLPVSTTYWVTTLAVLLLQMRVTAMARDAAAHLRFLFVGIWCMVAAFGAMALAGGHVAPVLAAAVLLALSQVFYGPSFDVLVSGHARTRGLDTGVALARQHFWQNLGMMIGSLAAGALFDLGVRWTWPAFGWLVLAGGSLALLAGLGLATRHERVTAA
jgi:DHA1 family multidrug resistance protein-like MFS transporter